MMIVFLTGNWTPLLIWSIPAGSVTTIMVAIGFYLHKQKAKIPLKNKIQIGLQKIVEKDKFGKLFKVDYASLYSDLGKRRKSTQTIDHQILAFEIDNHGILVITPVYESAHSEILFSRLYKASEKYPKASSDCINYTINQINAMLDYEKNTEAEFSHRAITSMVKIIEANMRNDKMTPIANKINFKIHAFADEGK